MNKRQISIEGIPAVLWGPESGCFYIAVHGDQSHKEDDVIAIFAGEAAAKGHRVLSFDLPGHGGRLDETRLYTARHCVEDLEKIMRRARIFADGVNLFGCSLGAYFGMLAYRDETIGQALFLSPVVDMKRIIDNMMAWLAGSEERREKDREIAQTVKTLS